MFAYCGNNPVIYTDSSGEFFIVAYAIVANIWAIISSNITISRYADVEPISKEDYKAYGDGEQQKPTCGLSDKEKVAYIKRAKLLKGADGKLVYTDWSEAEMLREMNYHDSAYRFLFFAKNFSSRMEKYVTQAKYADFEKNQNAKTYLFRFVGNTISWQ